MPNVLVTGAQWGDEGKGKIVDHLAARADFSVRFGGGANAGHTLVVGGKKIVLHLVPAGILHARCRGLVGNGCVVEPKGLLEEIDGLTAAGIDVRPERLRVSELAHVVTDYHRITDRIGGKAIGTTGRGIGPAYTDKVRRTGVRLGDVLAGTHLAHLEAQHALYGKLFPDAELPSPAVAAEALTADLGRLAPYVGDIAEELHAAIKKNAAVLFEGAQGALLDVDHGTYPFVTSSTTTAGGASSGVGVYVELSRRVAVLKAYSTRVGNGPFPTELSDETGERIRAVGHEFGATTGRPRRCGWLDLPALRHAFRLNGVTDMALTKLDVLAGLETIRVATEHRAGVPVLRDFEGFGSLDGIESRDALPKSAKVYLDFLESALDAPISLLSLGAERDRTLVLKEIFPS
jgi:adenylosuccinate synthase